MEKARKCDFGVALTTSFLAVAWRGLLENFSFKGDPDTKIVQYSGGIRPHAPRVPKPQIGEITVWEV